MWAALGNKVEGLACEEHGLIEIRSTIWMGLIFVDLTGKAGDFEDRLAPLYARWDEFFRHASTTCSRQILNQVLGSLS